MITRHGDNPPAAWLRGCVAAWLRGCVVVGQAWVGLAAVVGQAWVGLAADAAEAGARPAARVILLEDDGSLAW